MPSFGTCKPGDSSSSLNGREITRIPAVPSRSAATVAPGEATYNISVKTGYDVLKKAYIRRPGTAMPSAERKYSEQEVEEILEKAVEGDPAKALAGLDGMSLTELKAIGAEVGIEPERIESAARSLVRPPAFEANPLVGGPTAFDYEVRVPGEIPQGRLSEVVALIRRITGKPGTLSELHGTLEWHADGDMGSRWVTVSPNEGHTTIRASARLGQGALLSLIPTAIAGATALIPVLNAPSADGNPLALVLIPGVLALYLATRGLWSRHARKEANRLHQVVEELSLLAESLDEDI